MFRFPYYEWQYESKKGWKKFDKKASDHLESLYEIYRFDDDLRPFPETGDSLRPKASDQKSLLRAYVKSGKYEVDFSTMKQTSREDHKIRKLRRSFVEPER